MSSSIPSGRLWNVDIPTTDPAIPPWPCLRETSTITPGLYELSRATGNNATYYIMLYAKAVHFMDFDDSKNAENEFCKITNSFMNIIPELFPDARVLLLWNVTLGFTTVDLMHRLGHSSTIYIVLEPDQYTKDWFTQFHHRKYKAVEYQTRAILFVFAHRPEQWTPTFKIIQDFEKKATHPIDFIAFKWGSRGVSNKPQRLKVVNMPGANGGFGPPPRSVTFGRRHSRTSEPEEVTPGPQPGYIWLDHLPRSIDDTASSSPILLSPISPTSQSRDSWMPESARLFIRSLRKVVETICSRGRSVWFMVRPLESRALLSGPSDAKVSLSHWGILISGMTRSQLEDRINESPPSSLDAIWGDLHELRNHFGTARYECSTYRARDNRRATKLDYLGQTEINDERLFELGNELILSNPKYHLLKNNCQVWVEKFLAEVCPSAETDRTIAQVLRSYTK